MKQTAGRLAPVLVICLVGILFGTGFAASRILWYGNSYSEAGRQYDMLPLMVNCDTCGVSSGMTITTEPHMFPGCDLTCLEGNGALTSIDTGHYDYVMAADGHVAGWFWMFRYNRQPAYHMSAPDSETMEAYNADLLTNWSAHAKSHGGKLVIVQEWVQITNPPHPDFTQDRSDRFYDSLFKATGAILSPEGKAWWNAYKENPNLEYVDINWNDGCHPGRFSAYLNVCCQFAALTGKSPVGHKFRSINCYGTVEQLPADQALFAQQKAWEAYLFFHPATPVMHQRALTGKNAPRIQMTLNRSLHGAMESGRNLQLNGKLLRFQSQKNHFKKP
jgi:hypothetical protein